MENFQQLRREDSERERERTELMFLDSVCLQL